jgi:co-chaperonin GroES (HSP10)
MALLDPRAAVLKEQKRFELKIHEIAPEDIEPLGDRYVVEVIEIDEKVELGQLLIVTQSPEKGADGNPLADPTVERRGVIAAVVLRKGNGHLLGLPDWAVVKQNVNGIGQSVERPKAQVPMFFEPGDVVFIDHNARGRALKILGRECRIINQIDVLARIDGIRLQRDADGNWEEATD